MFLPTHIFKIIHSLLRHLDLCGDKQWFWNVSLYQNLLKAFKTQIAGPQIFWFSKSRVGFRIVPKMFLGGIETDGPGTTL